MLFCVVDDDDDEYDDYLLLFYYDDGLGEIENIIYKLYIIFIFLLSI